MHHGSAIVVAQTRAKKRSRAPTGTRGKCGVYDCSFPTALAAASAAVASAAVKGFFFDTGSGPQPRVRVCAASCVSVQREEHGIAILSAAASAAERRGNRVGPVTDPPAPV